MTVIVLPQCLPGDEVVGSLVVTPAGIADSVVDSSVVTPPGLEDLVVDSSVVTASGPDSSVVTSSGGKVVETLSPHNIAVSSLPSKQSGKSSHTNSTRIHEPSRH